MQGKKFDKNTVLAFLLMGALLLGYMYMTKPTEEQLREREQQEQLAREQASQPQEEEVTEVAEEVIAEIEDSQDAVADSTEVVVKAEDAEIESSKFKLVLDGEGGRIKSLMLKGYYAYDDSDDQNHQKPLYLIEHGKNHFDLKFKDASGKTVHTADLAFSPTVEEKDSLTVVTMTAAVNGGKIQYIYSIGDDYTIGFDIRSEGLKDMMDNRSLELAWKMTSPTTEKGKQQEAYWSQTYYRFKGTNDVEYKLFGTDKWREDKDIDWIAFKQQFFSSILTYEKGFEKPTGGSDNIDEKVDSLYIKDYYFAAELPVSGELDYRMKWDFVPLDYNLLSQAEYKNLSFNKIIPFGWSILGWINRNFFFLIFSWLASFGIAYGWVIFWMTIVVKLVLSPIMYKQYRQSAMMRVLRPEINEINEKFKGKENAMKRQQETMGLYRKAGANPLSGCLPAILQIPIFYALFRFFPNIIQLRGKSFLWADDLTAFDSPIPLPSWVPFMNDHLSLFALFYVIAMVVYFKISGSMDNFNQPKQEGMPDMSMMKYMMYVMPLFFFVFLNNYASGLSWYYLVSNVLNIGIVLVIKKVLINDEKIHAKIQENKKKPKKKSKWSQRMAELMEQAQEQKRIQDQKKKRK